MIPTVPILTINKIWGADTTLVDNVHDILKGDGNFYYQIEAVEGAGIAFNFGALSRYNVIAFTRIMFFAAINFTLFDTNLYKYISCLCIDKTIL